MSRILFKKICVVGVGLIGASIGLAVKKRRIAGCVAGLVRKRSSATQAVRLRIVDEASTDPAKALHDADLVILCTPVSAIASQLNEIRRHVAGSALVIDVGSVKESICRAGRKNLGARFVGCHPMAGSHKTGMRFADPDLFEGSTCFVTRHERRILAFWNALGAKTVPISPEAHDHWVAQASHLPHVLSFALFRQFPLRKEAVANPSILGLDRLSQSDPALWADILLANKQSIGRAIKNFRKSLDECERALALGNRAKLSRFIREANHRSFRADSK